MAEVTVTFSVFQNVEAKYTYDDTNYQLLNIQILNYSDREVTATAKKLGPPAREYQHIWNPSETTIFSTQTAKIYFTYDAVDQNLTLEGITLTVRYG